MTIHDDTLIYDLETKTFGKPDSSKDILRVFGSFSYKTGKYYIVTNREKIQKIIDAHKYLIGFNNIGTKFVPGYDNPILKRENYNISYKIFVDLKNVIKGRASQMKIKKGMLGDLIMKFKLDYITKMLGLVDEESGKKELDYNLLKKDVWTPEEKKEIFSYTKRDIEITKKLYEWVEEYFDGLKPFISDEDVRKKVYINSSTALFGYKAICKAMDWEESFNVNGDEADERISGGYVGYPAGQIFSGDIYCLDFNSLYPHVMIQCNLYGRKKPNDDNDKPFWFGKKWKTEGSYYSDELNGVSNLLKKWYGDRVEYKKIGDKKEYTIKIILNIIYGLLNNPYYERVYDRIAGGDCTRLGRAWTKFARKTFRENGYPVIYTDTDSVYIIDKFNDKEKMLKIKDKIINDIKQEVPFPVDTFDMGIDDEIKYMYFFKGQNKGDKETDVEMDEDDFINKPKGLMKKNYIYVTKDDKVVIKNLGIKKKSNSALSKKIFWEHLVPEIKKGTIKFSKKYIEDLIMKLLNEDLSLAMMRKDVGPFEQYKIKSPTSLPGQIANKYGAGVHFLIPNKKYLGVGKGKKFCTLDEFNKHKLTFDDIDLSNVWKELDYFIKPPVVKNIFDF